MMEEVNSEHERVLLPRSSRSHPSTLKTEGTTLKKGRHIIRKRHPRNIRQPKSRSTGTTQPGLRLPRLPSQTSLPESVIPDSLSLVSRRSFELKDAIPSSLQAEEQSQDKSLQAWEYLESIGEHLLELQAKFPLPALSYSAFFGASQRIKCVSLISKNCASLGLRVETQFLAFDIFHRICTAPSFVRYHSALKAAASLYIAAKYQEVCPPRAMAFAGFSPEQTILPENVIKLEGEILQHLDFNLGYALPVHFVQLLASRYSLSSSARAALVRLCLSAVVSEPLWLNGGSWLGMACVCMVVEPQRGDSVEVQSSIQAQQFPSSSSSSSSSSSPSSPSSSSSSSSPSSSSSSSPSSSSSSSPSSSSWLRSKSVCLNQQLGWRIAVLRDLARQ